jgi:hypothetical protein
MGSTCDAAPTSSQMLILVLGIVPDTTGGASMTGYYIKLVHHPLPSAQVEELTLVLVRSLILSELLQVVA